MKKHTSLAKDLESLISKHIEQDSDSDFPFKITIAADQKDNVKVVIKWPKDCPPAKRVTTMSAMLSHINSGHWAAPMQAAVRTHGINTEQQDIAQQILINHSSIIDNSVGDELCVTPLSVFSRNN